MHKKLHRDKRALTFNCYDWLSIILVLAIIADLGYLIFLLIAEEDQSSIGFKKDFDFRGPFSYSTGVLFLAYCLRLFASFTYHLAVDEHYLSGEFSDTDSERIFNQAVEAEANHRFERKVEHHRMNKDLETIRETAEQGENPTAVFNYSPSPIPDFKGGQLRPGYKTKDKAVSNSMKVADNIQQKLLEEQRNDTGEYHSFNLK